jgi:predicted outer membrane repeat protein
VHKITGSYSFRIAVASVVVLGGAAGGIVALSGAAAAAVAVPCSATSLISAISAANTTPADDSLSLASGCVYSFAAANNTTDDGNALPVITGSVSIAGNGATITRSGTAAFRFFDVASTGSLALNDVTLSNGLVSATNGGGAIFNHGPLTVTSTTFSGNTSTATVTSGGAINSSGPLTVSLSTFTGNTAQEGGGIFNQSATSTATVTDTTFSGNTATTFGGGAIVSADGTTNVARDTFAGNNATGAAGGGAIDNDATVNITNSTFNGNTGGTNGGGAIQNFGTATITWSTISGNSSPFGADLHNLTTGSLTVAESIVANGGGGGTNCSGTPAVVDGGYNIDTGTSCGFATANHSKPSTNPQLGALASNGGPTQTMALPSGSPAVDAVPTSVAGCSGSTDQRGITRPQGTACDIGAYELVMQTPPSPSPSPSPTTSSPPPPPPGGPIRGFAGKCIDDFRSSTADRNKIDIWTCNGTAAQRFTFTSNGELRVKGKCVDDRAFGHSGTKVVLFTCNGGSNQRWIYTGGSYVLVFRHLCLDDPAFSRTNGTPLDVWSCNNGANQKWSLPA